MAEDMGDGLGLALFHIFSVYKELMDRSVWELYMYIVLNAVYALQI